MYYSITWVADGDKRDGKNVGISYIAFSVPNDKCEGPRVSVNTSINLGDCRTRSIGVRKRNSADVSVHNLWVCPCRDDSASCTVFTGLALRSTRKRVREQLEVECVVGRREVLIVC